MTLTDFLLNVAAPTGIAALAAALASGLLERISAFNALSSAGKYTVAVGLAVVIAVVAKVGAGALIARPDMAALIEPYAQIVIAGGAVIAQQLVHGATKKADDGAKG